MEKQSSGHYEREGRASRWCAAGSGGRRSTSLEVTSAATDERDALTIASRGKASKHQRGGEGSSPVCKKNVCTMVTRSSP